MSADFNQVYALKTPSAKTVMEVLNVNVNLAIWKSLLRTPKYAEVNVPASKIHMELTSPLAIIKLFLFVACFNHWFYLLEIRPCEVQPCNTTHSECKKVGYDDFKCKCDKGYKTVELSDEKLCEGNVCDILQLGRLS